MTLSNPCTITIKGIDRTFNGHLDNISANGFAFISNDNFFADSKGQTVQLDIKNFAPTEGTVIEGRIIRSSNNEGSYIVGCQMPDDNKKIMQYIEEYTQNHKQNTF